LSKQIPAVSIIIPMYNVEKYIGECLDSILNQTFTDYEVIVVDDCSTDKSCEVVESYLPKFNRGGVERLYLFRSKVNSGGRPGIPRNTGIRFSRGEYIMFIDSDDVITSTALEELYDTAKDFNADALHCGWWYATEDGTVTTDKNLLKETSWEPAEKPSKSYQVSSKLSDRVSEFIADKFWGGTVSNFVKRSLIATNGIKFPPYSVSEDFVFKFQLICLAENLVRSANIFYV